MFTTHQRQNGRSILNALAGAMLLLLLLSNASAQHSSIQIDSANKEWGFGLGVGAGAVYHSTGLSYFLYAVHDHLQIGFRSATSLPDNGDNQSSSFLFFPLVPGNSNSTPDEQITDQAFLIGFRLHGKVPWLTMSAGPSYTSGTLRGSTLLSADTTGSQLSGNQQTGLHYNTIKLQSIGFTTQLDLGLKLTSFCGFGISTFYTINRQVSYAGFLFTLTVGMLR